MRCLEFFEEMLSLVFNLTSERISSRMWQTLPLLYDLFNKDNTDYFTGTFALVFHIHRAV